ncbi:formyl transferase [Halobiforma lacisalsi AJ5]|uniref:Formyl transferase n=1 Tax=Natronobacterium lacisalsi AJ5 TaxID=358396 RepID=M0M1L7_NATLA|nr:formyltransferase family protein [Halobiforma lacisalsi]APW97410.1 formyl transferase [Halobiforma lacisalsi AJ5]EMA38295.1 formyl transferase [Halobiforma lacisalsi AJ5]
MSCTDIGVLLDGEYPPAYQTAALEKVDAETAADVSLVVVNEESRSIRDRSLRRQARRAWSWGAWLPVWKGTELLRSIRGRPAYDEPRHVSTVDAFAGADVVGCTPNRRDELWATLPDPIVDRLAAETDVVIRFGFGLLTGRILEAPEYGVLSFHYSDIRDYRGRIGGLWEFIADDSKAGVTLQQLTDRIDGGRIVALEQVPIEDTDTYQDVKHRQRDPATGTVLVDGVRNLNDPGFEPAAPDTLGTYRTAPTLLEVARFLRKNNANKLKQLFPGERPASSSP